MTVPYEFKVGSLVSLEDNMTRVVLCRGEIKKVITKNDRSIGTVDGLHYFPLMRENTNGRYNVEPREETERSVSKFYTPFRHLGGIPYKNLADYNGLFENDENIYLDVGDESLANIENDLGAKWKEIYPESSLFVSIKNDKLTYLTPSMDEDEDIQKLLTDHVNIFGRDFSLGANGLQTHNDDLVARCVSYLFAMDYLEALIECNYRKYPEDDLLYINNHGRRSFQWELWSMCNNLCSYCYLGKENRHTDKERQMTSLTDLHRAIDELDTRIYNNISIIGGDFWQGQLVDKEVHDSFMLLMEKCAKLYEDRKIGSLWITCTMTIGDQHDLYEALDIFEKHKVFPNEHYGSSGLWLCTSWDVHGRFHTPDRLENWDYHMKHIHETRPWVKFNCTIILMEDFLQNYIDGKWSPKQFSEEYHTCLFYKQIGLGDIPQDADYSGIPIVPNADTKIGAYRMGKYYVNKTLGFTFAPHRETMLKFLRKYAKEDPETYDRLFNIKYRADELHRNYNDMAHDSKTTRNKNSANESDASNENILNVCGHMINYACYVDSDKCCICDKFSIWDSIYGG